MMIKGYRSGSPALPRNGSERGFHIQIQVFDGKPLAAKDLAFIRGMLERIPARFLAKGIIDGISLYGAERMGPHGGGAYACGRREIEIARDENFATTLAHEIGEAIFANGLEPHERARFLALFPDRDRSAVHQDFANYIELHLCGKVLFSADWPLVEEARLFVDQLMS